MNDLNQELIELREKLKGYEDLIKQLSAPIIPSIVPNAFLVPLNGILSVERFHHIQEIIVNGIAREKADTVLIDFTGISSLEVEDSMGYQLLNEKINDLVNALNLMGVETLFVGFSPQFAQNLILSNGSNLMNIKAYDKFKTGLQYLLDKKGLEIRKKGE
ncbi:STAS domain-containing protein [Metabacillus fastidiosus]|uniref:STAS domain-containing protein n=1 Tax=Metabacillus fastidiosus TaxID=1458 RepID=UPI003D28FB0D